MTIFTREFWHYAAERAIKTASQTLGAYLAGGLVTAWEIDPLHAAGITLLAALASVCTSLGTSEETRQSRLAEED